MTATDLRPAVRTNRVARHLCRDLVPDVGILFALFLGGLVVVGAVLAAVAEVPGSMLGWSLQVPRWFALGWGAFLTAYYLPLFVAHGRTRREAATGSAVFAVAFSAWLAVLVAIGYALEAGVYHLLGWAALLPDPHPVGSLGGLATTLGSSGAAFLGYVAVGALCGGAFYRRALLGVAAVPVGLALLGLLELGLGGGAVGPLAAAERPIDLPAAAGALVVLGAIGLAAALTWAAVRDLPLRPR